MNRLISAHLWAPSVSRKVLALTILAAAASPSLGAVRMWSDGGGDDLWNTSGNWSNGVPGTGDAVDFGDLPSDVAQTVNLNVPATLAPVSGTQGLIHLTATGNRDYLLQTSNSSGITPSGPGVLVSSSATSTADIEVNVPISSSTNSMSLRNFGSGKMTVSGGITGSGIYSILGATGSGVRLSGNNSAFSGKVYLYGGNELVAASSNAFGTLIPDNFGVWSNGVQTQSTLSVAGTNVALGNMQFFSGNAGLTLRINEGGAADRVISMNRIMSFTTPHNVLTFGANEGGSTGKLTLRLTGAATNHNVKLVTNSNSSVEFAGSSGTVTYAAEISGAGQVVINGGTGATGVVFSTPQTYTGGTHVKAGTLYVNSASNVVPDTGEITLESDTTFRVSATFAETIGGLRGKGIVRTDGNLTVAGGISPGIGGIGELLPQRDGNLILGENAASTFEVDFANNLNDKVRYTLGVGNMTLDGTLDIEAIGAPTTGSWTLIDVLSGSLLGDFDTVNLPTGAIGGVSKVGNDLVLTITAVPEPGSATLLLAGAASVLSMRRRR